MILRIYFAILKIAARYCAVSRRFRAVFSENSKYNVYKMAYNVHKNGLPDFHISKDLYDRMNSKGLIVDGRKGGLLIGPFHEDGGVLVVRNYVKAGPILVAEIEGWEYVLSTKATLPNENDIVRLNEENRALVSTVRFDPYPIPNGVTVIDVSKRLVDGVYERPLLLIQGEMQWCVNRLSTKQYLSELQKMNSGA